MIKTIMNYVFGITLLGATCGASMCANSAAEETTQQSARLLSMRKTSEEQTRNFINWIKKYDKIHIVVGDKGCFEFVSEKFRKKAGAVIFIDPGIIGEVTKEGCRGPITEHLGNYPAIKKKIGELLERSKKRTDLASRLYKLKYANCTDEELNTQLEGLKSESCNFMEYLGIDTRELKEKWNYLCKQWNEKKSERKEIVEEKRSYLLKKINSEVAHLRSVSDLKKFLEPKEFETLKQELSLEDCFAFSGTWGEFFKFVKKSKEIENILKEKVEWVFDDWSILVGNEERGFGEAMLKEWLGFLSHILTPGGRIFISTQYFDKSIYELFGKNMFDSKLCMKNIRQNPEQIYDLTDSDLEKLDDTNFLIANMIYKGYPNMTYKGYPICSPRDMIEKEWDVSKSVENMRKMFFIDGQFGARFMVFEKKTTPFNKPSSLLSADTPSL